MGREGVQKEEKKRNFEIVHSKLNHAIVHSPLTHTEIKESE